MIELDINFDKKDPAGVIDYELDFSKWITTLLPNTITSLVWTVTPIAGDPAPLVVVAQANAADFSTSTVRLSGGTLGYRYRVRGAVAFADGEQDVVSFALPIGYT